MRVRNLPTLAAAVVVLQATMASAAMIVQESFYVANPANPAMGEYSPGDIAAGSTYQNPDTLGSAGSSWVGCQTSSAAGTVLIQAVPEGLTYPGASATGGSAVFQWPTSIAGDRGIKRSLTTDYNLNSPVYYISGLMSFDDNFSTATTATAYTSFTNTEDTYDNRSNTASPGEVIFGVQWGFQGNGAGGVNAMMRLRSASSPYPIINAILAENIVSGTHQFVFKVEPDISGSLDRVTAWLNPTSLASEAAAGTPVVGTYRNWGSSYPAKTLAIKGWDVGADAAIGFDEFRFGTSWEALFGGPESYPPEQHIGFREGVDGYEHVGSYLAGWNTTANLGDRDVMVVGCIGNGQRIARTVLGWDLSTIPENAMITGASLTLTPNELTGEADGGDIQLWSLVTDEPMDETEVTWNRIRAGLNWDTAGGGDNLDELLGTVAWPGSTSERQVFSTEALVAAVQDAVDNSNMLQMLLLAPTAEALSGSGQDFARLVWHSDDASALANRPLLTVTYMIPEPTSAVLLALAALAGLLVRRRRR